MTSSQLPSAFFKNSLWYAAAAGAVAGLAPQDAAAQVVYRDIEDVTVEETFDATVAGNPILGPAFDFDNDGDAELLIGEAIDGRYTIARLVDVDAGADTGVGFIGNTVSNFGYFLPLAAGATIGPASPDLSGGDGAVSFTFNGLDPNEFIAAGDVFIGVEFTLDGATNLNYGWIRVNMPAAGTLIVKDLAYETMPNTAIVAGNGVASEPDALAEGYRFSPLAPNPTTGTSSFEVAVGQAEAVRVEAFDALGRSVAVLHDGLFVAGQSRRLSLDASNLPAGVYVVRVSGESFVTTRRVTVAR